MKRPTKPKKPKIHDIACYLDDHYTVEKIEIGETIEDLIAELSKYSPHTPVLRFSSYIKIQRYDNMDALQRAYQKEKKKYEKDLVKYKAEYQEWRKESLKQQLKKLEKK